MKNKLFLAVVLLIMAFPGQGQDHHFSQFYATPLNTNPANTGNFKEDWRVSAIHRDQWSGINSSFISTALGVDMNFSGSFIGEDKLGIGLFFLKDEVGEGWLSNQTFLASAAWHRKVDHQKRHKVSLGLQGGFIQKAVGSNGLQFGNQYELFQFNEGLDNGENLNNLTQNYLDVELGVGWHWLLSSRTEVESGISVYQLTTPQENFAETIDSLVSPNELGSRISFTAGVAYKLNQSITLYPRILYMSQSKARDMNVGISAGYAIGQKEELTLLGGVYTRFSDAAIFKVGFKYKNVTTRFSYDSTYSKLNEVKGATGAGNRLGAWELSVIIVGKFRGEDQANYTVPCGIF